MLYDYKCTNCDNILTDVSQKMRDPPLVKCPECKKKTLQRIITGGCHGFVKGGSTQIDMGSAREDAAKHNEQSAQPEKPWYHKHGTASSEDINKMTKKQKAEYIMKGKK